MHGSKEEVPMAVDSGGVVIRLTEWGEMNVALETFARPSLLDHASTWPPHGPRP